ncbi:MAG: extracellular solute-binding protein [Desulfobacterales bacterium]|nr:extracellular solute-binding protein [Desulfobacterales bacterium]
MRKSVMLSSLLAALLWAVALWPGAAWSGPLDEIIAGSKKEGTVSVMLRAGFTPKSIARLEKGVKDMFGVDLKIKFSPTRSMTRELSKAIMEHRQGVPPTYDLMSFSDHVAQGSREDIFEHVDWRSLLTRQMNTGVLNELPDMRDGIIYYTGQLGLMYNPDKIPADKVPRSLEDLANPKWKQKLGMFSSPNSWSRWAFLLGKEKLYSQLRGILKNEPIQGRYVDIYNRYLLGEVSMCFLSSAYLKMARDKGVPASWQSLDFADIREYSSVVLKGARHPQSAKLVALYLASAEGSSFTLDESGSGNMYYPGNYEHDLSQQNKQQGVREFFSLRSPELFEFYASKEANEWKKEIQLILQTGGTAKAKKKK